VNLRINAGPGAPNGFFRAFAFQLHCRARWLNICPAMEFAVRLGKPPDRFSADDSYE
jgi:hypothetical protein